MLRLIKKNNPNHIGTCVVLMMLQQYHKDSVVVKKNISFLGGILISHIIHIRRERENLSFKNNFNMKSLVCTIYYLYLLTIFSFMLLNCFFFVVIKCT